MESFSLRIVTPKKEYFNGKGEILILTTKSGQRSFYASEISQIALLVPGSMTLCSGSAKSFYAIDGGVLSIDHKTNSILLLTPGIHSIEELAALSLPEKEKKLEEEIQEEKDDSRKKSLQEELGLVRMQKDVLARYRK
ncbi:MAG: hypothetical protein WCS91_05320 [Bacilli bacterium]